ncbi:MAG TPA: hypothetical protein VM012_03100 [Flavitalea sp.]|nr:hypothetical protein [Flavitalea sp.]
MKPVKHLVTVSIVISILTTFCSQTTINPTHATASTLTGYHWEQVLPFGNGSFPEQWKPGTFPLGIRPLDAFNNNLWMSGQKAAWSSTDGIHWSRHNKTDWGERIYSEIIFYQNKLWLFGGLMYQERQFVNDIWVSSDGTNWQKAGNASWSARGGHSIIVYKNKIWLFGGATEINSDRSLKNFLNDIWSSEDGIHWTQEMKSAPWTQRDNPKLLIFRDNLYMLGGQGQSDIWFTSDVKNWKLLNPSASWKNRYDNGAHVFDGKMWIFGGRDTSENHTTAALNDVWFSENGIAWTQQTAHAPWTVRSGATSIVYQNKLWIYSGKHTGGPYNWGGDVWTMRKE